MGFLRRLLGSQGDPEGGAGAGAGDASAVDRPANAGGATASDEEAEHNRELLREEAARLDDELLQRQLRYADLRWTPPDQGGPRRAGDPDVDAEA